MSSPHAPMPSSRKAYTCNGWRSSRTKRAKKRLPMNMPPMKLASTIATDSADAPITRRSRWNQTTS
jgi:hypothetical protein